MRRTPPQPQQPPPGGASAQGAAPGGPGQQSGAGAAAGGRAGGAEGSKQAPAGGTRVTLRLHPVKASRGDDKRRGAAAAAAAAETVTVTCESPATRSIAADDVKEPEAGSLDPNQASGDATVGEEGGLCPGTDEGDSGTAGPEDVTATTATPKRTHEADSVLGDTEEEDGRRKKRKEVDGKSRSTGSASTSKSGKAGANVGGSSGQQGCIQGTGSSSAVTPDDESERSPKVPPLKIVIPAANSADPEPGSTRGKVGMPRQALPYVVAAQEGSSGGSSEEASAGEQSQLSLLGEQSGAPGGTSEEGLRPQRVLRSSNKSTSNAPSPAPGSSSPHQVQRQSPLPTTVTEILDMPTNPATTVASQTSTITTEGSKTIISSSVTTAAGAASERVDSGSNTSSSSQVLQESQHQEQLSKEQKQLSHQSALPPPPQQQQQQTPPEQQSLQLQKEQEQEKDQEPQLATQPSQQQQQHPDQQPGAPSPLPAPPPAPTSTPTPQQQQAQQSQTQHETSSNTQPSTSQPMTFQASVELHPRKRKMKQSREGVVASSGSGGTAPSATVSNTGSTSSGQAGTATAATGAQVSSAGSDASDSGGAVPDVHPHDQPITNCYQLFLNIRKQIERRRKGLFPVQPKPPQGFKDYLMNRCTYLLAGNASSRMSLPAATPPQTLHPAMKDLFVEQEKERHRLRMQHVIEKEKLVLSVEQEILRVHGRAARALANQSLPYSVCTILKDEEVYNVITPEQEEKDRNARSRYNGRLFLSWLQDVDDKWEKIKEAMLQRHRIEAGSLHAVQCMDWEWKMKEFSLCEFKARPTIDETQVPMVLVNDDFDLLPA